MSKKKDRKQAKRRDAMWQDGILAAAPNRPGLLRTLEKSLGLKRREQFVVGALLGAAAVYVLSDEKLRGMLLKAGIGLYSSVAGGFAEMKEQMADIQAEMQAER